MTDSLLFVFIFHIEGDYVKILSIEVASRISQLGAYYIQFDTFTYIKISGSTIYPKKLPKYPSDKLILLGIGRKLEIAYEQLKVKQKNCWNFPISIGTSTMIRMKALHTSFVE